MKFPAGMVLRVLLFMLLGVIVAAGISELTFRMQGNTYSRDPQTIYLVIPAGTAQKVAQGQSVIPQNQEFVVGDTLVVKNEDSVTQTLGPLVIPPGASASMILTNAGDQKYVCSFQPSKQYGITVQEGITTGMRIQASLLGGLPLGLLLGVYSLIIKPVKPKPKPLEG